MCFLTIEYIRYALIHLTNKCNLACKHCRVKNNQRAFGGLETADFKTILEKLANHGTKLVTFTGGEPLLRNDLLQLVRFATDLGIKARVQTNGVLVSQHFLDSFVDAGGIAIGLSLDGIGKKHDDVRGVEGLYNHVFDIINNCDHMNLHVQVDYVVSRININDFFKIAFLLNNTSVNTLSVRSMVPIIGNYLPKDYILSPEIYSEFLNTVHATKNELNSLNITSPDPLFNILKVDDKEMEKFDINTGTFISGCSVGLGTVSIQPNGDLQLCSFIYEPLGNLLTESLESILKAIEFNDTWINIINRNFSAYCEKCKYKFLCGGCRARSYFEYNSLLMDDPLCPVLKKMFEIRSNKANSADAKNRAAD